MTLAEGVQLVTFGILTAMMIGGALGVVLLENIVYSAFLLGIVFVSMSGMYILLNAAFVAAAQVLVYVGAVTVLILFGIMLVNKRQPFAPMRRAWLGRVATGGVCAGLFALLTVSVLNTPWDLSTEPVAGDDAIVEIGKHFFSDYLLPFELASVLLLIAGPTGVYSRCGSRRNRVRGAAIARTPQGTCSFWFCQSGNQRQLG